MLLSSTNSPVIAKYSCEESIEIMAEAGFDAMDFYFNAGEQYYNEDTDSSAFKEYFLKLRAMAEDRGLHFNQAHAPFASSFKDEELTGKRFQEIVRSMRNASYLGVKEIVVHPMQHLTYAQDGVPEQLFEMNMDFYKRLLPYCEEYQIRVAVENMWQQPYGKKINHSTCSRPEEFIRYIDELNSEWIVGCLDIGHACLVCEDPAEFIRKLGNKRLKALHVHDVSGMEDSHTMPYFGVVNWDQVMTALKDINYEGYFTYEVGGQFLTPLPKKLMMPALKLLVETGRHLISKTE